ncbi:MAG TPA: imidazolonepropionase [Acidimicrobiales bacterium]|nr:imidazolonepropionase [Acidimicrobiales bacterium]
MADLVVRRAARVFGWDLDGPLAVVIRGGVIEAVVPDRDVAVDLPELDAAGRAVIPGFVDAHTHLAFAGHRADEFAARLAGRPYQAGGIMRTVEATRAATFEELVGETVRRAASCVAGGTTTIEVKSGYGLDVATERRLLEVVAAAARQTDAELVPTFLGAHLAPDPSYVDLVVEEMLPACAGLAVSCDAFCDAGALTVEQARRVLEAGRRHGLAPRIHAEELAWTGGARLAAELGCLSADHLVHATAEDAAALAAAGVVAVLLPSTSFCLRSPYAPARMLLDSGVQIALATDCNPGTSYTTSMPFVVALACSTYGLSVDEAIGAATEGGARALGRPDVGHLRPGARGDLVVLAGDHWVDIAYHPGMPQVERVVKDGVAVR